MAEANFWETVIIAAVIYFLPTMIAVKREHLSKNAIIIVNVALGWTVLGWLWALLWANTGNVRMDEAVAARELVKCPECAEAILKEAKVCKHCGFRLSPSPPP
jgi:hypothetical protein